MTKEEAKRAIETLSQKINYHNQKYYQESLSEITDFEFDELLERLIKPRLPDQC